MELFFSQRTVTHTIVHVANVLEVIHLGLIQEKGGGNTVDRRIAPSLIEKATGFVQIFEVVLVLSAPEKVDVADLKVAPKVTQVVA